MLAFPTMHSTSAFGATGVTTELVSSVADPNPDSSPPNPDPDPALVVKKISVSVQYHAFVCLFTP